MKKLLFWVTFPFMMILLIVISWPAAFLEWVSMTLWKVCHKWEHWCYDWKNMYPHMEYMGDGLWRSKPRNDDETSAH